MIYVLEDDNSIREFVVYALNNTGLSARGFERPSEFWAQMEKALPELAVLDIMLPEEDGMQVLSKLRASAPTKRLPVIMLTAKSSEYDKVMGLDGGADDYVAKPFSMLELISRIKALLRRTDSLPDAKEYRAGDVYLCPEKHLVKAQGREVTLTLKEYELLCLLMGNEGIVFTRDKLLDKIWGYTFDGESRTVDVHIRTLRQKLGAAGDVIETVRGVGYRIAGDRL